MKVTEVKTFLVHAVRQNWLFVNNGYRFNRLGRSICGSAGKCGGRLH